MGKSRTTRLNNVQVCCATLDSTLTGKNAATDIERQQFKTSLENVQITTPGTGIEDAMQELMTSAAIDLRSKALEAVQGSGLSENQISVNIQSVTADIEVPVGLP